MHIINVARLLALPAIGLALSACLGAGGGSPEQPLPLVTLAPDRSGPDANAGLSPEEARAQAVAEIRAKAEAHAAQHESAAYPPVFRSYGPPMAIASEPKTQLQIEAELARVRGEMEKATEPDEVAELEERMAELVELGRRHEEQSEQQIRAISEEINQETN